MSHQLIFLHQFRQLKRSFSTIISKNSLIPPKICEQKPRLQKGEGRKNIPRHEKQPNNKKVVDK